MILNVLILAGDNQRETSQLTVGIQVAISVI